MAHIATSYPDHKRGSEACIFRVRPRPSLHREKRIRFAWKVVLRNAPLGLEAGISAVVLSLRHILG
jgi:hypothetical protein